MASPYTIWEEDGVIKGVAINAPTFLRFESILEPSHSFKNGDSDLHGQTDTPCCQVNYPTCAPAAEKAPTTCNSYEGRPDRTYNPDSHGAPRFNDRSATTRTPGYDRERTEPFTAEDVEAAFSLIALARSGQTGAGQQIEESARWNMLGYTGVAPRRQGNTARGHKHESHANPDPANEVNVATNDSTENRHSTARSTRIAPAPENPAALRTPPATAPVDANHSSSSVSSTNHLGTADNFIETYEGRGEGALVQFYCEHRKDINDRGPQYLNRAELEAILDSFVENVSGETEPLGEDELSFILKVVRTKATGARSREVQGNPTTKKFVEKLLWKADLVNMKAALDGYPHGWGGFDPSAAKLECDGCDCSLVCQSKLNRRQWLEDRRKFYRSSAFRTVDLLAGVAYRIFGVFDNALGMYDHANNLKRLGVKYTKALEGVLASQKWLVDFLIYDDLRRIDEHLVIWPVSEAFIKREADEVEYSSDDACNPSVTLVIL